MYKVSGLALLITKRLQFPNNVYALKNDIFQIYFRMTKTS